MAKETEPHYGEESGQEPHMGETDEPTGTGKKSMPDKDDAKKAGMRPTGSGGSAPTTENM